jgi:heat shock protein HslJ
MRKYLLVVCALALAISACSNSSTSTSLIGKWKLTSYGPADSPSASVPDVDATIEFDKDGNVTGNSGCNGFGGTYEVKETQITFSQIVSTLMACDDPRMSQETAVFQVLRADVEYKIDGNTLTLTKDKMVLVFTSLAQ